MQERINKQSPFVRARYTTNEKKKEFLDSLIRFEVMANEAERRGYDKDPEVLRVMKQQMISKFLQKDFESKLKVEDVPDADVEKYYKEHPAEFNQKDEVRVSEVVVKDKGKADKAYAEAKALPKAPRSSRRPSRSSSRTSSTSTPTTRTRSSAAAISGSSTRNRPAIRSRSSRRRSSWPRSATSRRRSRPTRAGSSSG